MKKLIILGLFLISQSHYGQFFKGDTGKIPFTGYFNFYYDTKSDKIYLEVSRLDTEFLYVHALSEGLGSNDIGLDRGQLGGGVIVHFKKAGNKLLLIQDNQRYRAITANAEEQRSVKEAFAKSVLHGFVIEKEKEGVYLVDATDFFVRDAHGVANRLQSTQQGVYSLDKKRSAFALERTKAFPKNVEFDVILTFKGNPKGIHVRSVSPDATSVTVHQHHSFVALPDDKYRPRIFDPRSGAFPMSYLDYASPVDAPIVKRFIYRHRLEKKNPLAAVSEAKKPIIYYLDPGVPEPVRSALLDGARWWNQAFEAIGYKDAFQVKILPEGADPMDLRYHVIQWVHRSTRGWSYGSSISDPRTGEILKGHVSLGSLRIRQDFMIAQALQAPYAKNDTDDRFALEMALARIRQLSAHEVGHTLGFAHNFAASTNGRASVMDYPHPQLKLTDEGIDFSQAYAVGIGDWDKVTVAYSYQDFPENEAQELKKILNDAFARGMRYISDADARPKGGAHAYAHLWDNGKDATTELEHILAIRKRAIAGFSADNIRTSEPYSVLEDVFVPLYFFHRYQTEAAVKAIGGLDYSYAIKGGEERIVVPVTASLQKKALLGVLKTIDVETVKIPKRILTLFPPRAMGYGRSRESFKSKLNVAFDALGAAETATQMTMQVLLHPERASRMVQQQALDPQQLGLDEMLQLIVEHTFQREHLSAYAMEVQHTINFVVLNHIMQLAVAPQAYRQVHAIALHNLERIEKILKKKRSKGVQQLYNRKMLAEIQQFKSTPEKFVRRQAPVIPDGSPIGVD